MKNQFFYLFSILSILSTGLLSGCASIVSGTEESVSVTTTPTIAASCTLNNDKGQWYIPSTPASIVVHKSINDLMVRCQKPGYPDASSEVQSHVKAAIFGNALFGGAIGAGVDTYDGAGFDYPANINVPMIAKNN